MMNNMPNVAAAPTVGPVPVAGGQQQLPTAYADTERELLRRENNLLREQASRSQDEVRTHVKLLINLDCMDGLQTVITIQHTENERKKLHDELSKQKVCELPRGYTCIKSSNAAY